VKKGDGKLRPIQDYRPVNKYTIRNRTVSPLIPQVIDRLAGCTLFTTFDVRWGYNNIRIKEGDEWKAAFLTREGLFEPTVMFFGLTNSPATFQSMMNTIFRKEIGEGWLSVYMDDMGIHTQPLMGETEDQHLARHRTYVHRVLEILEENDLFLKPAKCHFEQREIKFLGVMVGGGQLRMDPAKLKSVADWKQPRNVREIRKFLGFTGYYRYFIPNYSRIARPLLDLTKTATPWEFGPRQLQAFEELRDRMCEAPVLQQPDFERKFFLQVDASNYGVGAVLSQEGAGDTPSLAKRTAPRLHPTAYFSATFTPTERNYDIYEKELLAIMKSLAHWRPYLGWTKVPFTILTDHANLQYWKAPQNLNRRTARWHADLQEYDYELKYIPGKTNIPADELSRPAGADQGEEDNKNITIIPASRCSAATTTEGYSEEDKRQLMNWTHDHGTAGHPGRDETIRKTRAVTQWPGMNTWITDYVRGCATCQQNKINTHRPRVPLYRITVPENALPFQQIAMDLITGLPLSKGKDAILTIVDHGCTRAAVFIPCNTTITGLGIAQLYMRHVYKWFGLPNRLISDRDPRITSHFGKALAQKLGITQNLSTTAHPQTDGLSERKNQWVEQYLRLVTSLEPETWADWLPIATLVHNNRRNATTKISPNQALLGYEPQEAPPIQRTTTNAATEDRTAAMKQFRSNATAALNATAHKTGVPEAQYKLRDQVWLEGTNLRLPHQASKLAPKRYGPFQITQEISPVAYRLGLPAAWTIHDVFHASLLTPYQETTAHGPNYAKPPPDLIEGAEEYEVERITHHRYFGRTRKLQYLIKWKGYPDSDNTWEPAANLHAAESIQAYWDRTKEANKRLRTALLKQHPPLPSSHWTQPRARYIKRSALAPNTHRSGSPPSKGTTINLASTSSSLVPISVATSHTSTNSNTGPSARKPIAALIHRGDICTCHYTSLNSSPAEVYIETVLSRSCLLHPSPHQPRLPSSTHHQQTPSPLAPLAVSSLYTPGSTPSNSETSPSGSLPPFVLESRGIRPLWIPSERSSNSSATAWKSTPGNITPRQRDSRRTMDAFPISPYLWTKGLPRLSDGSNSSTTGAQLATSRRMARPRTPMSQTSTPAQLTLDQVWGSNPSPPGSDVSSTEACTSSASSGTQRGGTTPTGAYTRTPAQFAHLDYARDLRFTDEGGPRGGQRRRRRGNYGTRGRVN
jgi:hypothetical protein